MSHKGELIYCPAFGRLWYYNRFGSGFSFLTSAHISGKLIGATNFISFPGLKPDDVPEKYTENGLLKIVF